MSDFINSNELSKKLKIDEIYNLFKTESLEFNKNFLSNLEKYPNAIDFIEHYTKVDTHKINSLFNNILLTSFKIMNEDNENTNIVEFELYSYGVSKIISLLCLIQKINKLQTELIKNTKNYIKNFYINNKRDSPIKGKIDFVINNFISSSKIVSKTISRNSADDNTNISFSFNMDNNNNINDISEKQENQSQRKESDSKINKNEFLLLRTLTPKFDETQITEQNSISNNNNNNNVKEYKEAKEEMNKRDTNKIDSSLTLQKINFINMEEKEEIINKNAVKKYPSHKVKHKHQSCDSHINKRKKNKCHSTITKCSLLNDKRNTLNSNDNNKRKILAELLDSINILFKDGKITSKQKINMKQIIISSPKMIIDKYYKEYRDVNNQNIQNFLIEELQYL